MPRPFSSSRVTRNSLTPYPAPPQRIIQAMKLCLATDIKKGSLTENLRNLMGSAVNRLPYFVNDEEARRLNAIQTDYLAKRHLVSSEVNYRSVGEMHDWTLHAAKAGMALRCQLADFIAVVERFDPNDPLYWERVYDLAKI